MPFMGQVNNIEQQERTTKWCETSLLGRSMCLAATYQCVVVVEVKSKPPNSQDWDKPLKSPCWMWSWFLDCQYVCLMFLVCPDQPCNFISFTAASFGCPHMLSTLGLDFGYCSSTKSLLLFRSRMKKAYSARNVAIGLSAAMIEGIEIWNTP